MKTNLLEGFYIIAERLHHYLHEPKRDRPHRIGPQPQPLTVAEAAAAYESRGPYTLIVDLGRHEVSYQGLPVTLPPMAFRLLSLLAEKPDRIVSKEELYDQLWGKSGGDGVDPGPYEHQLADHKRKILVGIEKAFEVQYGKKPKAGQLKNLISAKPRVGYRLDLPVSEVRVIK